MRLFVRGLKSRQCDLSPGGLQTVPTRRHPWTKCQASSTEQEIKRVAPLAFAPVAYGKVHPTPQARPPGELMGEGRFNPHQFGDAIGSCLRGGPKANPFVTAALVQERIMLPSTNPVVTVGNSLV